MRTGEERADAPRAPLHGCLWGVVGANYFSLHSFGRPSPTREAPRSPVERVVSDFFPLSSPPQRKGCPPRHEGQSTAPCGKSIFPRVPLAGIVPPAGIASRAFPPTGGHKARPYKAKSSFTIGKHGIEGRPAQVRRAPFTVYISIVDAAVMIDSARLLEKRAGM